MDISTINANIYPTLDRARINPPNSGKSGRLFILETDGFLYFAWPDGTITLISGGGGGGESLALTLAIGNTTGGNDIVVSNGDSIVFQSGAFTGTLDTSVLTANRNWLLPNASGTIALVSDIPAPQDLQSVLSVGNQTGGNDIVITDTDSIVFLSGLFSGSLDTTLLTGNQNWLLPDNSGTIALLSDIPAGAGQNIYNTSDSLTANRVLDMVGFTLLFTDGAFPSIEFLARQTSDNAGILSLDWNARTLNDITAAAILYWGDTDGIGIGVANPTARLEVWGLSNTSADYAFKAMDSAGIGQFEVRNDSLIFVNALPAIMIDYNGFLNTFYGANAGNVAANNDGNTGIGDRALSALANGFQLVAVGNNALTSITNGGSAVAVGYNSQINTTASENVSVGANTLMSNTTGAGNTVIGTRSGFAGNGSLNVFVGYEAGYFETGSNTLFIDNDRRLSEADARVKALIYGIFDPLPANQHLTVNAQHISVPYLPIGNAGVISGELYVDTAANVLANGDLIVARKV